MKEILPGLFHWKSKHPEIGKEVSSYFLIEEAVLLDPLVPEEGLEWFENREPREIILSNRLHVRDSAQFQERFGCRIWAHEAGIEQGIDLERVSPFDFGYELPGSIEALEIGALCPDETALLIPRSGGILAFADGLIRGSDEQLTFVDGQYLAESPEKAEDVKAALTAALDRIAEKQAYEHLIFAHGDPLLETGARALKSFVEQHKRETAHHRH